MPRSSAPRHATALATIATTAATSAAPGPGAGSAPPADTVKATSPAAVETATPAPRFGRKPVNDALARSLVGKTRDTYLGFSGCDAARAGLFLPRCIVLIVGTTTRQTLYQLTDTKCPSAAPRTACYAGYVIGVRADAELAFDAATLTSSVVTNLRVGTKTKAARAVAYALPVKPAATVTQLVRVRGGSSHVEVKVQAGGVTVLDTGWDRMASGTLSCADQAELATNVLGTVGALAGAAVGAYIGVGGALVGLAVAAGGSSASVGLGTPVAITAGAAISASGMAFGAAMALAVREFGNWGAKTTGVVYREVCEHLAQQDQIDPEELETIQRDALTEMGSGGGAASAAGGSLCNATQTMKMTCDDGSQVDVTCESSWSDGVCKMACVAVCD